MREGKGWWTAGFASLVCDTLQQGGTSGGFVLIHQVDIDDLTQQSLHVTGSYPHGQESSLVSGGIASKCCRPFGGRELGCEIVRGEDGDSAGGVPGGGIHGEDEVAACLEVPGLEHGVVAFGFQVPGDPFGPALVSVGIADEVVFRGVLSHGGSLISFDCLH